MAATDHEASEAPHRRLSYLPALDGVRAFAVIAVMMYHGGLSFTTGGFLGVDTFFVLSGFLITSLLVGEWRQTLTIKLSAFWARRARRLLPALFLMMLFVALLVGVIVPSGTYPSLRLDALSTLFYVSNWHFILIGNNYFNETAPQSPLIHTWSLAVEEQFYLIWPLVVLTILHFTKNLRLLLTVCCTAAVASAIWMYVLFQPRGSNSRLYYGTDTRSQCLFIGAALAVALIMAGQKGQAAGKLRTGEFWRPSSGPVRSLCAFLGVVGAAMAILMWATTSTTSSFPYQGGFFLMGLATAGVILAIIGAPRTMIPRFLSLPPIRYIGRISYGLYIWHWPLFICFDASRTGLNGYPLFVVRVAITFAVSAFSYHMIERPIRQGTFLKHAQALFAVPASVVVVILATVLATTTTGALTTIPPTTPTTSSSSTPTTTPVSSATTTPTTAGPPVRVLLLGDSTALTLGEGLGTAKVLAKYNFKLSDLGILGCGVAFGPEVELMGERYTTTSVCNGTPYSPSETLKQQPYPYQWLNAMAVTRPNVVVLLAGRWEDVDRLYDGKWTNILNPVFATYVKKRLEAASELFTAAGVHMVFMTAPCTDEGEQPNGAAWPEDNPARVAVYNRLVREVAAEFPITDSLVNLNGLVCPGGKYTATFHGVTIRNTDGVHFTVQGGETLAPYLMPKIIQAGRAQAAAAATTTTTSP
jgi:peptidoglycan/LPS O-acetylase OafA/YrhL